MPIETKKRLIDANLNRLREGIRVLEDIARYILNDFALASSLKALRHKARISDSAFDSSLLQHRDIKNDILKTSTPSEKKRENLRDIAMANFKRSEESARVLEEICKLDSANSASCGDFLGSASARFLDEPCVLSSSLASHNPKNSSTILEFASCAEGAESALDSANQIKSAESGALCEIFKTIRYELYDIEIAYFRALETIENKNI